MDLLLQSKYVTFRVTTSACCYKQRAHGPHCNTVVGVPSLGARLANGGSNTPVHLVSLSVSQMEIPDPALAIRRKSNRCLSGPSIAYFRSHLGVWIVLTSSIIVCWKTEESDDSRDLDPRECGFTSKGGNDVSLYAGYYTELLHNEVSG